MGPLFCRLVLAWADPYAAAAILLTGSTFDQLCTAKLLLFCVKTCMLLFAPDLRSAADPMGTSGHCGRSLGSQSTPRYRFWCPDSGRVGHQPRSVALSEDTAKARVNAGAQGSVGPLQRDLSTSLSLSGQTAGGTVTAAGSLDAAASCVGMHNQGSTPFGTTYQHAVQHVLCSC